jgi:hypothetical protein
MVQDGDADPPAICLVDWEFAGSGEGLWDVACFLGAGIGAWLSSIPHVPARPPGELSSLARVPFERVRPGLASFWHAYATRLGLGGARHAASILRAADLVGARLVHLAFEGTTDEEYLRSGPVAHLQVALNVLEDSRRAAWELMGVGA